MDKIICIGKNYLENAKELGDAVPEKPVLFLKPPSVLVQVATDSQVILPSGRGQIHPECEIVLRLTESGTIDAVTLGLDMTLRDVQASLKKNGHPWEISKVFPGSAIIGKWIPFNEFPGYLDEEFSLLVDGKVRQRGLGAEMRLSPSECIAHASEYFPLRGGDALFTGTPAGVGPVTSGQIAELTWGSHLKYRVRFL
jgi:2-keto-4-pentenoate hydratase/2-oxohepta-3-ene-1,7-dioic acid hydratase in catechol pathway